MKKIIIILMFVLNIFINFAYCKNVKYTIKPVILDVFDGDTILIKTKEGTASVRLTGIDCYETKMNSHIKYQKTDDISYEEIFERGRLAKERLENLISDKNISLEITGIDRKYGRFVGVLYSSDGKNINKEMLKDDLCKVYVFKPKK